VANSIQAQDSLEKMLVHQMAVLHRGMMRAATRMNDYVNWDDAQAYVAWLSRMTGKTYRLLTEAEWEYAARAGSQAAYSWGDEIGKGNANCDGCGSQWDSKRTAPVGSFAANAFGLHDMHGNVWEWVEDCYHENYNGAPKNGSAWTEEGECSSRVVRGGSWNGYPRYLRAAFRGRFISGDRLPVLGFRVGRTLDR
jgi:formylglycine-generating enzyme required for sulfatase activity